MKKIYTAPQTKVFDLMPEHSMMLTASNVKGNGIQLTQQKDGAWEDQPNTIWESTAWEE